MYQSELHTVLRKTLERAKWTRSTKDEDNFRQVVCSALYEFISPNIVEIPSTRSGHGDIRIFGRKIELKYASNEKVENLEAILEDFDLVLDDKIEFSIVAIRLDASAIDNHLHRAVKVPMLAKKGVHATFGDHGTAPNIYKGISIFLAATFPHAPKAIALKTGKGKNATSYLSFESSPAIARSSFMETPKGLVHVDVIGCKEDGLIVFIYKKAHHVALQNIQIGATVNINIPCTPTPLKIASMRFVNASSVCQKFAGNPALSLPLVESNVPCFTIYHAIQTHAIG